jgi:hypothetical protein
MKKYVVLAALASLLVAVGVSSTLAAAAVTSANGTEVILPDGNVYQQNADGTYSLIPDVATANAMRLDWNALESVGELPGPAGEPLPSVVELTNARVTVSNAATRSPITPANGSEVILPDGNVYQQNADGTYSLIPDVATANAMRLDWNALESVGELPGPAGDPLPSVNG